MLRMLLKLRLKHILFFIFVYSCFWIYRLNGPVSRSRRHLKGNPIKIKKSIQGSIGPCEYHVQLEMIDWTSDILFLNDLKDPIDKKVSDCIRKYDLKIFDIKDLCQAIEDSLVLSVNELKSINGLCTSGRTPLQEALAFGNMKIVDIMSSENNNKVVDVYGRTISDYLKMNGSPLQLPNSNIDVVESLTHAVYLKDYYLPGRPVLIRDYVGNPEKHRVSKSKLEILWQKKRFRVSPVAYPKITKQKYCNKTFTFQQLQRPIECDEYPPNTPLYHAEHPTDASILSIFGLNIPRSWKKLKRIVNFITHGIQLFFGPNGSGATYHFHGSAFNILYIGTKHWLIGPPHLRGWSGTSSRMLFEKYSDLFYNVRQRDGDAIILPANWGHMTKGVGFSLGFGNIFKSAMENAINKKKIWFIHVNKAGGSSIYTSLKSNCDYKKAFHGSTRMFIDESGIVEYEKGYTFGFVRNPYARQVSNFHFLINVCRERYTERCKKRFIPRSNTYSDFNDWIMKLYGKYPPSSREHYYFGSLPHENGIYDTFNATQTSWFVDEYGKINVDDIYYLENIEEDFEILKTKIPCLKGGQLPHKKKGTYSNPWQSYYTNQTIVKIMDEVYDIDFKNFNYSKLSI